MGEKHDEDPLTYEKVQQIIDMQLAHIEELQAKEDIKEIEKKISPVDVHLESKSWLVLLWRRIKRLLKLFCKRRR